MEPVRLVLGCVAAVALGSFPASAQSVISARSGLVDLVEGEVLLQDQKIEAKYGSFPEVKEKAILKTNEGRSEVLLNPGVFLRLAENSSMKMITNRLIDTRVELLSGSAIVEAAEIAKETAVTVVCNDATVSIRKAGVYRFDFGPARLRVHSGEALVELNGRSIEVTGGKMLMFEGENAAVLIKFDRDATDSFSRWSRRRSEYVAMANVSAAKSLRDSGYSLYSGVWRWNPYFGMMTYVPARGVCNSPYGWRYWSPVTVERVYYTPPPMSSRSGWDAATAGGYQGMGGTSSGYSGTMASSNSSGSYSSPAASSSSGASSAASGSSSVGHGSAGGGGGGRGR